MEASTTSPPAERAVKASTVTEALRRTAAEHPDLVAFRTRDDGVSLTWAQFSAARRGAGRRARGARRRAR